VQYWNGAAWVTCRRQRHRKHSRQARRSHSRRPISTDRIRVVVNAAADNNYSRVVELEAFSCAPAVVPDAYADAHSDANAHAYAHAVR
jgi:hypothetical protein